MPDVTFVFPPHKLCCVHDALRCWCRPRYHRVVTGHWRLWHRLYWAEGIEP